MRTICVHISYDGTDYAGWQRQSRQKTVQGCIEQALAKVTQEKISILGSGRTDAGVHAKKQVAAFRTACTIPVEAFTAAINTFLPQDIRVLRAEEKAADFHAIGSAVSKKYRYFFTHQVAPNVFMRRYVWQVQHSYDLPEMKKAAALCVGTYDFASFATHGVTTKTTDRTIYQIVFGKAYGDVDYIEIHANGFLRHMVRSLVGTFMDVALGKKTASSMASIISSQNRCKAGQTAPANGLFLWDVFYE